MKELLQQLSDVAKQRRSRYALEPEWVVPQSDVEDILKEILLQVPSAFNSQPVRMVLLTGDKHKAHWQKIEDTLIAMMGEEAYNERTKEKIHNGFMNAVGTVLFYDDTTVTKELQEAYPTYAEMFPDFAAQVQGSHQYAVWVALSAAGFGASLQHYIGMVDDELSKLASSNIPDSWRLIAQMPFGKPIDNPSAKDKNPTSKSLIIP